MPEWHGSFGDAWRSLEARDAPLGTLTELLPDDDGHHARVWLIALDPGPAAAVAAVQARLAHLSWLRMLPGHLLHVTLGRVDGGGAGDNEAPAGLAPFRLSFARLNALHGAVVAEVGGETDALRRATMALAPAVEPTTFLPHVTVAAIWQPAAPAELRAALEPLRDVALGEQVVSELLLCDVPAGRGTFMQPWTVLKCLPLEPA